MSFTPVDFIDTWALASSLRSKLALVEEPYLVPARLKDWNALANVIARIKRLPQAQDIEIREVWLEQVAPHSETPWQRSPDGRAYLPIVTNPSCAVICGLAARHIEAGWLTMLAAFPACVVNWGEHPHFHLALHFRPKQQEPT